VARLHRLDAAVAGGRAGCGHAAGQLDAWSGRFLRVGADNLDTLRGLSPEGTARQLRLRP